MTFNPTVLKNFFRKISRSGMADDVAKAVTKSGTSASIPSTGATLQQLFKNSNPASAGKLYGEDLLTPSRAAFMDVIDGTPKFKASGVGFGNKPLGLIDIPDDVPKTMSLDDLVLDNAWRKTHNVNKAPMTSDEFVNNYKAHRNATRNSARETKELLDAFPNSYANAPTELDLLMQGDDYLKQAYPVSFKPNSTPDYEAMDIDPAKFGQRKDLIDSMEFPDGFKDPDAYVRYYTDLAQGYTTRPATAYTTKFGRKVSVPDDFFHGLSDTDNIIIDGKIFNMPKDYDFFATHAPETLSDIERTKASIIEKYVSGARPFTNRLSEPGVPMTHPGLLGFEYRDAHANTALGKFFKKYGRFPKGTLSSDLDPNTSPF